MATAERVGTGVIERARCCVTNIPRADLQRLLGEHLSARAGRRVHRALVGCQLDFELLLHVRVFFEKILDVQKSVAFEAAVCQRLQTGCHEWVRELPASCPTCTRRVVIGHRRHGVVS